MKQTISLWQTGGFLFTSVLGTFLHFLFDLTGGSFPAAFISAVNESIWEHLKLLFYPMLLFAWIEYRAWGKELPAFWCIKLRGILLGLVVIPVLYYTYTGILGASVSLFNVTLFFLAAGLVFWMESNWFHVPSPCPLGKRQALLWLCLIAAVFTVFTFAPPLIPFFEDPVSGTYGFQKTS